ncbi:MAG TPA: hypothetical protein VM658_08540 [bacterium]|nr:hypothetical protein [bacterium]
MNITRKIAWLLIAAFIISLWPGESPAIPVFARKYGFNCTMCHSNFPRLNDFGWRYRQNGYQIPGRENEDKTVLESPPPFAARVSAGYNNDSYIRTPGAIDTRRFEVNGLDLLSGGLIGRNIGYFLIYPPQINASRGVQGQDGTVEMANVIFSNLASTWLNVRAGRFEPAYAAVSVKRNLAFSPCEIYDVGAPNGMVFSETQEGIEVTGYGYGLSYAAGYVNGSPTNDPDDGPTDYYVRMAAVLGQGEGQTAGQRIGVTGYWGSARPDPALMPRDSRQPFSRVAVDASLNFMQINLTAQYLTGQDNRRLWGAAKPVSFEGGFAELSVLPATNFVGLVRYDWVNAPVKQDRDITRWTGAIRYYPQDNLALHFEYSQRKQQNMVRRQEAVENFYTVRMDFVF